MKKLLTPLVLASALIVTGCGSSSDSGSTFGSDNRVSVDVPGSKSSSDDSFVDGVLTTHEMIITITDSRVIAPGEEGNKYSDDPVLAIWYDVTNRGADDRNITPSDFIFMFDAYQDNNPDRENTLSVGGLPDSAFLDSQMENIKPDGTVASAVAYELDDTTTPVDLVASRIGGTEIGRMTFELN